MSYSMRLENCVWTQFSFLFLGRPPGFPSVENARVRLSRALFSDVFPEITDANLLPYWISHYEKQRTGRSIAVDTNRRRGRVATTPLGHRSRGLFPSRAPQPPG